MNNVNRSNSRSESGVTLIEVLVVISIISILVGLTYWSMGDRRNRWWLEGAANDVAQVYSSARYHAIRKNTPALVQLNNIGNNATSNIEIWEDINRNGTLEAANDTLVKSINIPNSHDFAFVSAACSDANNAGTALAGPVQFLPNGTVRGLTMPIRIILDSQRATNPDTYQVDVQRSGIARVETTLACP